jgi:hypothetical protein
MMTKNYVYRMDHDTGFAPHVYSNEFCSLSGCKPLIEKHTIPGGWVIGIGGNGTHKPNKLIYAMKVAENIPFEQFKKDHPKESKYLDSQHAGKNVLISHEFYYLGDEAIDLPQGLKHIVIKYQGCKCIADEDVAKLSEYLISKGYRHGKTGNPNNPTRISQSGSEPCRTL